MPNQILNIKEVKNQEHSNFVKVQKKTKEKKKRSHTRSLAKNTQNTKEKKRKQNKSIQSKDRTSAQFIHLGREIHQFLYHQRLLHLKINNKKRKQISFTSISSKK